MMKQMTNFGARLLTVSIVVLAFAMAVSCSNDNDDPGLPGIGTGVTATFAASGLAVDNTISLQPNTGAGPGDVFLVDVVVQAIDQFYGATFDVNFNDGFVELIAIDVSNSFIIPAGGTAADLNFLEHLDGQDIAISRADFQLGGVLMPANQPRVLATLQFRALRAVTASPIMLADFDVTTCTVDACDLDAVATLGITVGGGSVTAVAN